MLKTLLPICFIMFFCMVHFAFSQEIEGEKIVSVSRKNNEKIVIRHAHRDRIFNLDELEPDEDAFKPVSFGIPRIEINQKAAAWSVYYENCCTSYPVPLVLVLYAEGKIMHRFRDGQMIWKWIFWDDGEKVAIQTGPTHGDECTYTLYSIRSGKKISDFMCSDKPKDLWVMALESGQARP